LLTRGRLLAQTRDFPGAVAALDAALEARPNHPEALRARAEALLRLRRDQEALRDLDCLLGEEKARQPGRAPLYRARAGIRANAGDHQGAIEDYTLALGEEPDHADDHAGRGWQYLAVDAVNLAQADFDRAVRLDPKDGDAHNGRAFARVKAGRYQEAVDDAERAIHLGPPTARHRYNAARVYAQAYVKATEDAALQNPRGRAIREAYQDRAVALLGDALAALPPGEQKGFWSGTVQRDRALHPVWQCHAFQQLAAKFVRGMPDR
jgi:tetratricopeptide (TPR) repeat protein